MIPISPSPPSVALSDASPCSISKSDIAVFDSVVSVIRDQILKLSKDRSSLSITSGSSSVSDDVFKIFESRVSKPLESLAASCSESSQTDRISQRKIMQLCDSIELYSLRRGKDLSAAEDGYK